jgi:hypothetical protein
VRRGFLDIYPNRFAWPARSMCFSVAKALFVSSFVALLLLTVTLPRLAAYDVAHEIARYFIKPLPSFAEYVLRKSVAAARR